MHSYSNAFQRKIFDSTGLSIVKVDYYLKALIDIGFIKVDNFMQSTQKINDGCMHLNFLGNARKSSYN